jgi:hypothetical protein
LGEPQDRDAATAETVLNIEAVVRLYGAERIVCGTDSTEFGCDWHARVVRTAQPESAAA